MTRRYYPEWWSATCISYMKIIRSKQTTFDRLSDIPVTCFPIVPFLDFEDDTQICAAKVNRRISRSTLGTIMELAIY